MAGPHLARTARVGRLLLLSTAFAACGTIGTCAIVATAHGDLPAWVLLPRISHLGCVPPARYFFQLGFGATGALLAASVRVWAACLLAHTEPKVHRLVRTAANLAHASAIGLAALGLCPMQRDCFALEAGEAPLAWPSVVHALGSTAFFGCGWAHGFVSARAYAHSQAPAVRLIVERRLPAARAISVGVQLTSLATMLAACAWLRRARGGVLPSTFLALDATNQYLSVLLQLGLYLSYTIDLAWLGRLLPQAASDASSSRALALQPQGSPAAAPAPLEAASDLCERQQPATSSVERGAAARGSGPACESSESDTVRLLADGDRLRYYGAGGPSAS